MNVQVVSLTCVKGCGQVSVRSLPYDMVAPDFCDHCRRPFRPTKSELLHDAELELEAACEGLRAARGQHRMAMAKWRRISRMRER